jgi:hypothetical protein
MAEKITVSDIQAAIESLREAGKTNVFTTREIAKAWSKGQESVRETMRKACDAGIVRAVLAERADLWGTIHRVKAWEFVGRAKAKASR